MRFAALCLFPACFAVTPNKVSQTLARVPILQATFEILDFGIRFECPVVVSTSCSSRNVLEDSFQIKSDVLVSVSPESADRKSKDGLAATGWVTVGTEAAFPAVISQTDCSEAITTVCIGPGSEFVLEHPKFRLSRGSLIPGESRGLERIVYSPAIRSSHGWSMMARSVHFGDKKISSIVLAINTDQVAPIAISDVNFAILFGEDVFTSPSADNARLKFYRQSSSRSKLFRISTPSKLEFKHADLISDGRWFEIITDRTDPRYNQIGLGYDMVESFDIHFDLTNMRIGFKVSV